MRLIKPGVYLKFCGFTLKLVIFARLLESLGSIWMLGLLLEACCFTCRLEVLLQGLGFTSMIVVVTRRHVVYLKACGFI